MKAWPSTSTGGGVRHQHALGGPGEDALEGGAGGAAVDKGVAELPRDFRLGRRHQVQPGHERASRRTMSG